MTEKRLAQISVVLSTIIIMTYAFLSSYFLNKSLNLSSADLIYFALSNLLSLSLPFVCAWFPYLFVRPAAVTGSALSAFGLFLFFAITSSTMDDPKGAAAIWVIYFFWLIGAALAGVYPALFKPHFFTKTATRALVFSALFTVVVSFIIGFLISRIA
ncbi:TPA: hypothetical protein RNY37_002314 [Pasteurella multocida]|nr:hypothetical protein [Pasteurella multocida]HDX1193839.1 hypothetical protein [Pasteurella multocida]